MSSMQLGTIKVNLSVLGGGAFGTVYRGFDQDTKELVAVKKLNYLGPKYATMSRDEIKNAQKVPRNHENIVRIRNVTHQDHCAWIIMDFCELGDLNAYFYANFANITNDCKGSFMIQIMNGITFLHENDIVHRDMKPGNILLKPPLDGSSHPCIKISDFGLSKFLSNDKTTLMSTALGTLAFQAPEFWDTVGGGKVAYRKNVDVFAAGLIFLAMLQVLINHSSFFVLVSRHCD